MCMVYSCSNVVLKLGDDGVVEIDSFHETPIVLLKFKNVCKLVPSTPLWTTMAIEAPHKCPSAVGPAVFILFSHHVHLYNCYLIIHQFEIIISFVNLQVTNL